MQDLGFVEVTRIMGVVCKNFIQFVAMVTSSEVTSKKFTKNLNLHGKLCKSSNILYCL